MNPLGKAGLFAAATFVSAVLGFAVQALLPAQMLVDSRGLIGAIAGVVALLLALVLGLVIWTSHGIYTTQVAEGQSLGPMVLQFDHFLEQLGPAAAHGRQLLKSLVLRHRDRFWGDQRAIRASSSYAISRADAQAITDFFDSLSVETPREQALVATGRQLSSSMIQTQLLMARQLAAPLSPILLLTVGGWSLLLFFAYGLASAPNALTLVVAALGSLAVASAVLLIFKLSQPYEGLFRISPDGIDQVLATIGREANSASPNNRP